MQGITGTSANNTYTSNIETNSYWYKFSDHSDYYSGNNSVIGAGSIVTKNIPEKVVAVGNACRVLRSINC